MYVVEHDESLKYSVLGIIVATLSICSRVAFEASPAYLMTVLGYLYFERVWIGVTLQITSS